MKTEKLKKSLEDYFLKINSSQYDIDVLIDFLCLVRENFDLTGLTLKEYHIATGMFEQNTKTDYVNYSLFAQMNLSKHFTENTEKHLFNGLLYCFFGLLEMEQKGFNVKEGQIDFKNLEPKEKNLIDALKEFYKDIPESEYDIHILFILIRRCIIGYKKFRLTLSDYRMNHTVDLNNDLADAITRISVFFIREDYYYGDLIDASYYILNGIKNLRLKNTY